MSKKLFIIFVICSHLALAGWLVYCLYHPKSNQEQWRVMHVEPGMPMLALAEDLEEEGFLSSYGRKAFIAAAVFTGRGRKLQPGRYRFSPSMSPWEILSFLAEGRIHTLRLTIPEGFTAKQVDELLQENGISRKGEFISLTSIHSDTFETPFPKENGSLEGYLFPDTYEINGTQGAEEIVHKMLARFEEVIWKGLFSNKATVILSSNPSSAEFTLHEVITLASLVEGEARVAQERSLIAGILLNRLSKGMKLECDATVQYALGERKERLSYADLQTPSPYNTYLYFGLPPGPINNPGRASIEAVLYPTKSHYLFYVAKPDGSHIFSRTFKEHCAAIARIARAEQITVE